MSKLTQDQYARLSDEEKCLLVGKLLRARWSKLARPEQVPFSDHPVAKCSMFVAGRGAGKSRSATQWILDHCLGHAGTQAAILGPTYGGSVGVGIHSSESGILSLLPDQSLATWNDVKKILTFVNGSRVRCFSSEHRRELRGPEFHIAWIDEMADLSHGMDCWQVLFPAVRLKSDRPAQVYLTGTPRPTPLMLHLMEKRNNSPDQYELHHGATKDNIANLDESTVRELYEQWEGTRYFRQEIEGILLMEAENALWTQDTIAKARIKYQDLEFRTMALGIDPAVSSDKKADHTGMILGGLSTELTERPTVYILGDYSRQQSALDWARDAIRICIAHGCSTIVYEKNLAGPLLLDVMRRALDEMDAAIRLVPVQARGKKYNRAEPTAALYEAGKVKHMPIPDGPGLDQLESQMVTWEPTDRESPDRIDALVHLVEFLFKGQGGISIMRAGAMPWSKRG